MAPAAMDADALSTAAVFILGPADRLDLLERKTRLVCCGSPVLRQKLDNRIVPSRHCLIKCRTPPRTLAALTSTPSSTLSCTASNLRVSPSPGSGGFLP